MKKVSKNIPIVSKKTIKLSRTLSKSSKCLTKYKKPETFEEESETIKEELYDFMNDPNIEIDCITDFEPLDSQGTEIISLLQDSTNLNDEKIQRKIRDYLSEKVDLSTITDFKELEETFRYFYYKANNEKFKVMLNESNLFDDVDYFLDI
jgi:hypothetical protein